MPKKKNVGAEPIARKLVLAKQERSAREFKEITKEMNQPRVAVSVKEFLLKQFESEIRCRAHTLKLIADNLRGNSALVKRLLKEVESELPAAQAGM